MHVDAYNMFDSLLCSYEYNRDEVHLIEVYKECIRRLMREDNMTTLSDFVVDDADIIHGTCVMYFGDYGTSPRYGWIDCSDVRSELKEIYDTHIRTLENEINCRR